MSNLDTMSRKSPIVMSALLSLISSYVTAQPPKHPGAEKALAGIMLDKDFGDDLRFSSRETVTLARNEGVPGLNGLLFMKWNGDNPGSEVLASVQWFEKKDELLKFYTKSIKKSDYKLGKFEGTTLWKIGKNGFSWTDGEHFLVSLGGSPVPPSEMVKAWLTLIESRVDEVEKKAQKTIAPVPDENLGEGYSRRGNHIYFNGKRIDLAGASDINQFAVAVGHKLTLCRNVDADSFKVLSREYTRDKNKVYYKWISPGSRFWVVEIPKADPETFEAVGFELARDKNHVWIRDSIVDGADPKRVKSIFAYRIWIDTHHVWNDARKIDGADPETFERIGTSEFGYYRDANRVYSYFGRLKVIEGADPRTFKTPKKK